MCPGSLACRCPPYRLPCFCSALVRPNITLTYTLYAGHSQAWSLSEYPRRRSTSSLERQRSCRRNRVSCRGSLRCAPPFQRGAGRHLALGPQMSHGQNLGIVLMESRPTPQPPPSSDPPSPRFSVKLGFSVLLSTCLASAYQACRNHKSLRAFTAVVPDSKHLASAYSKY